MERDKLFLRKAITLAKESIKAGGGPFGAVIVKDNVIVAEASNSVVTDSDPTAHAEINVIRIAAARLSSHELTGCTLYSSCEPCPMCFGAIYWAGIKRVVYGGSRVSAERAGFSDKFIYDEIALFPDTSTVDFLKLLDAEAEEVFEVWLNTDGRIQY